MAATPPPPQPPAPTAPRAPAEERTGMPLPSPAHPRDNVREGLWMVVLLGVGLVVCVAAIVLMA